MFTQQKKKYGIIQDNNLINIIIERNLYAQYSYTLYSKVTQIWNCDQEWEKDIKQIIMK